MSAHWHGYVLFRKPAALPLVDWGIAMQALRQVLGKRAGSSRPAWRMHWRVSIDKTKVIMEAMFDLSDLDPEDLARLCKYVSDALDGRYTPEQVRDVLRENVRVFAANEGWRRSNSAARAYIAADLSQWEEE